MRSHRKRVSCSLSNINATFWQSVSLYLFVGENLRVLLVLSNLLDDAERLHDLLVGELSDDGVPGGVLRDVVVLVVISASGTRPENKSCLNVSSLPSPPLLPLLEHDVSTVTVAKPPLQVIRVNMTSPQRGIF